MMCDPLAMPRKMRGCENCVYVTEPSLDAHCCDCGILQKNFVPFHRIEAKRNVRDCCYCAHFAKESWEEPCLTCGILQKNFVPVTRVEVKRKENKEMNNDITVTNATQDTTNINLEFITTDNLCIDQADISARTNVEVSYPPCVPPVHVGYKYQKPNAGVEWISHPKIDYSKCYPVLDRYILTPKRIWFTDNGCTTTVEWMDGTKTTVRAEDPEKATPYCGFTAALAKKIFGTSKAIRKMNAAIDKAKEPARIREEKRKAEKEKRKADEEQKRKSYDWRVARRVEELKIEQEARDQIAMELQKEAAQRPAGKKLKETFDQTAKELLNQSDEETKQKPNEELGKKMASDNADKTEA